MNELVGKKIERIFVAEQEKYLGFILGDVYPSSSCKAYLVYEAIGDCCSESWFADIVGFEALKDALVGSVEVIETQELENDPRTRQERDLVYGYKFTTTKGHATIAFRNSSNGYYGGDLSLMTNPIVVDWKEITGDWSA